MQKWKQALLAAYCWTSQPVRAVTRARLAACGKSPVIVLFYHRVADAHPNDWTLSCRRFQRQMQWLRRHVDLVSLEEAQHRIRAGSQERLAVSITFDDGYADNCAFALPLLLRERIPCTYFVSLQHVLQREPFPHDRAAGQPLEPNTLEQLRALSRDGVEIGLHTRRHADLGRIADPDILYDEVVRSGEELAELVAQPIRYFAFPYGLPGNLNREAFALARQAGYLGVCSAYGGYNLVGSDPFHLRRIHADPQWVRWLNWLTVDPRKLAESPAFEYCSAQSEPDVQPASHQ